jgi:hypothetical protein
MLVAGALCRGAEAAAQEPLRPVPVLGLGVDLYRGPRPAVTSDYGASLGFGLFGSAGLALESDDHALGAHLDASVHHLMPMINLVPATVLAARFGISWRARPGAWGRFTAFSVGVGGYVPSSRYASWSTPAAGLDVSLLHGRVGRSPHVEMRFVWLLSRPGPAVTYSTRFGWYPGSR